MTTGTALSSSHRLLGFTQGSFGMLISHSDDPQAEAFCPVELRRSLCRWENEGRAVREEQTGLQHVHRGER
jgi:hypothetical protein